LEGNVDEDADNEDKDNNNDDDDASAVKSLGDLQRHVILGKGSFGKVQLVTKARADGAPVRSAFALKVQSTQVSLCSFRFLFPFMFLLNQNSLSLALFLFDSVVILVDWKGRSYQTRSFCHE
jgi:hypothetical protein